MQGFSYLLLSAIGALGRLKEPVSYCTIRFDDNEVDTKRSDGQPNASCPRARAIDNAGSSQLPLDSKLTAIPLRFVTLTRSISMATRYKFARYLWREAQLFVAMRDGGTGRRWGWTWASQWS